MQGRQAVCRGGFGKQESYAHSIMVYMHTGEGQHFRLLFRLQLHVRQMVADGLRPFIEYSYLTEMYHAIQNIPPW